MTREWKLMDCFSCMKLSLMQRTAESIEKKIRHLGPYHSESQVLEKSCLKIGLAGRTGCGKSSFLNVLLGMYDYVGNVSIDGTDTKQLSLTSLRKGISIMTQVGLEHAVLSMPQGLDTVITGHSLEWSVGQKQLFCLARTLLKGRKIVLMDEPTSSLDNETGKLLWDKAVELLDDCTVIIVSRMPSQLTFCNRIVNMDAHADASLLYDMGFHPDNSSIKTPGEEEDSV